LRLALALLIACTAAHARAAVIEGQVRHATRSEVQARVPVQLIGFDAAEKAVERRTRTDASGRFRFADLPAPAIYLVRPEGDGFVYPGKPIAFRPDEPEPADARALELLVYDSSEHASPLRIAQVQWVVERDAGDYRISQRARIANSGQTVVRVGEKAPPLLRVALAPGHGHVATPFDSLPAGVEIEGDLALIRGPVFPGDEGLVLQLSYDLAAASTTGALETRIGTPDAVDQLDLYVQDFGIEIEATGLHPSRVARESDVFFQSFIGFELPAQGAIPLRVTPLPPFQASSRFGAIAIASLLAAGLAWFVGWPVTSARRELLASAPAEEDPAQVALRAALRDLEHDFETGKLSAEDRARLEQELTRASAASAPAPAQPGPRACSCGRVPAPADRFCAACGHAL
jgi:hypothetical protein